MSGYEKLKAAVERDCNDRTGCGCFNPDGCDKTNRKVDGKQCFHAYCDKFKWVIDRAKHYAEKTGLPWEAVLDGWDKDRNYWYMNYYQDSNQPEIKGDRIRVFESGQEMIEAIGEHKFRCPSCGGVSSSPYACNSGLEMSKGKKCDWKVYGLFGDMGKGVFVYCKAELTGEKIFMPLSWEDKPNVI